MNKKDKLRLRLYERDGKNCHYCKIKEGDFIPIWGKFYKGRGKILELERKDNEKGYSEKNCVLACAICNNAKSNKFTCEEFKEVGKAIKKIWLLRKEGLE
ncbi:hypothetical protein ES695_02990 [Candidatus Atribacteria bacterium 1244-E10-H5-B2]|nr:MAG: hypothetical protein ES695_02990 [Candidatus Atribacteria bacterium 1244-E10-H5-B2]